MKRLLSLILAIAMIATFIPAVSAAGTIDATDNMKIVYDFTGPFYGMTNNTTNPMTNFVGKTDPFESFWKVKGFSTNVVSNYRGLDSTITIKQYAVDFEINVPTDGIYNAVVNARWNTKGGSNDLEVTIKDGTGTAVKEAVTQTVAYAADKASAGNYSYGAYDLKAGTYTLTFNVPTAKSYWLLIYSLTLTAGEDAKVTPFIKEYTAPAAEIAAQNETTTMSVIPATVLSDTTAAEGVSVSYSSSNDKIAKVDTNGNISGVADGTVQITATVSATNCDNVVTKTATVKVGTGVYLDPNAVTVKYDFVGPFSGLSNTTNNLSSYTDKTDTATEGAFWKVNKFVPFTSGNYRGLDNTIAIKEGAVEFQINVPADGIYDAVVNARWNTNVGSNNLKVTIKDSTGTAIKEAVTQTIAYAADKANAGEYSYGAYDLKAGTYTLSFEVPTSETYWLVIYSLTLTAGSGNAIMGGEMNLPNKISLGEEETAEAVGYLSSTGAAASFTYSTEDTEVVDVAADGKITPKKCGTATITATCADALEGYNTVTKTITVAPEEVPTVSLWAGASVDGADVTVTVNGDSREDKKLLSEARGADVTVTAPEKDGYLFVGWFRGSKDTGRFVWADSEYTFNAMTHTMLTAVYEEATEKAYYNFNGEFLGTEAPSSKPTMLGYNFDGWNETVYNNLTRFVAKYLKNKESAFDVEVQEGVTVVMDEDDYYYDTKVTLTSNTDVTWLRNGKPVAYGREYTFYVWDDVTITTDSTADTTPKVILDSSKSGVYMIEYDAGDKTIVEKGIIFGTDADITIDSCEEKMNSQRSEAHGQFCASSNYSVARGYIIYEDGNEYRVIYSD
ncbi:MAG: Ig-like domain-containing protein [Oscillospiraceae bacterium]|nr:Ig-like domain-containing protein [Oscillospiraceae bacterium]